MPMSPTPMMPMRRPKRPSAFEYAFLFQVPVRRSAVPAAMWRSIARRSPIVSSATARAFLPGTLHTKTPSSAARSQSIVLVPAPARTMRPSESAWSSAAAVTLVERTISTSKPAMCSGKVSASRSGMRVTSSPAASSRSTAASGSASASSTFIVRYSCIFEPSAIYESPSRAVLYGGTVPYDGTQG